MGDASPGFLCCSLLLDELARATDRLGLPSAAPVVFGSSCHLPNRSGRWPPAGLDELLEQGRAVLACCMNCRRPAPPAAGHAPISALEHPDLQVISVQTQGALFLGDDATERAVDEGAFIVLPGWLRQWRRIVVDGWGFDENTAPLFFQESATRLLFLDTGRSEPWEEELAAMAAFVALPVEVRHVGISHLELLIDREIERRRHRDERAAARKTVALSRAQSAEHAAVVDFITRLGSLPGEQAIVQALEEIAQILFAPEEARFVDGRQPAELPPGDERCFAVDVAYGDAALGTLVVRGLAMPEHRTRYLSMAQAASDAAAIALNASRLYGREQDLVRQLGRKVEELGQFTYVASHDLQAPLRRLVSFSGLLSRTLGDELPEKAARFLGHIEDSALLMRTLVEDLLRLSRAGNNPLRQESLALDACVDRAVASLASSVEQTGAEIRRQPLPRTVGDSGLISQLFQNLLGNALKFVPAGRAPQVEVSAAPKGDRWLVTVSDNGIGIDPAAAERIFAPFQRLHGVSEYEGTGIGLSICRRVVERHGGELWVEPGAEGGSVFRFTLPGSPD